MHHFQNTARNPSSKVVLNETSVVLVGADMSIHQSTVQDGAQIGTSDSRVITLQKIVKYCTFCRRDYHTENECRLKYPNLAPKPSSNQPGQKRRRGASDGNNSQGTTTESEDNSSSSYFAEGQLVTF